MEQHRFEAADEQSDDRIKQQGLEDACFAGERFIDAIVRPQLLEVELDLPAYRVGLRDGVGVARVWVDVGKVNRYLVPLGSRTAIRSRGRRTVRQVAAQTRRGSGLRFGERRDHRR